MRKWVVFIFSLREAEFFVSWRLTTYLQGSPYVFETHAICLPSEQMDKLLLRAVLSPTHRLDSSGKCHLAVCCAEINDSDFLESACVASMEVLCL